VRLYRLAKALENCLLPFELGRHRASPHYDDTGLLDGPAKRRLVERLRIPNAFVGG